MADEKQDLRLSLQGSHFRPLPRELFLNIFNSFSLEGLGNLLFVNKFFLQVSYEAMLFAQNAKDLLLGIFYTSKNKKPLTKKFLRDRIHLASPQKVDLSNAQLSQIRDYDSFPEKNIILKNVHDTEFYQTTLLNKILFKILAERHRCDDAIKRSYNYVYTYIVGEGCKIYPENRINIDIEKGNFFEHCILYRFNMLPSEPEARGTLKCSFRQSERNRTNFVITIGSSDVETLKAMEELMASRAFLRGRPSWFSENLQKNGEECSFKIWIDMHYAFQLFLTNPIHIALYLLNLEYFFEEDFQESCEVLLTEIEKFRGFSNLGVPDEELDKLTERLKAVIASKRCFDQKQTEEKFVISPSDPQTTYSRINQILNNKQEEISGVEYLQRDCKKIQIQAAIKTIETSFGEHRDNKANCQKAFKEVMNSPDLNVSERAEIFNHFKDRIELNRHKNPEVDDFFGIENTTSWRETWKEIRDDAKQKLFNEVDALPETQKKRALLKSAKTQPLFCDHRNNTVLKGAFGRTQAVRDIKTKLGKI